jgi:transposase
LPTAAKAFPNKQAGKQPGSPGYGRTQKLAVTGTCDHRPESCTACARALSADAPSKRYTAWDEIDIAPPVEGRIGLMFLIIRHYLLETNCDHCDHVSRAQPWRSAGEHEWERVELGEWRLVGPQLAGLIVFLALRLRLSRPRIREALMEMFGLLLSVGVIDETLREAGRASFPLEDVLVADLLQEPQLNVDETSWPENRLLLWLWALVTPWTVLFVIGPRHAEMLENVLQDGYCGILISDGYRVYRAWLNRLRCWPHLIRKLRGLAESSDGRGRTGPAPLGHCTQHQPRHALRSGHARFRSPGQRHRNLPSSRRLLMAHYLGTVIRAARKGLELPRFPLSRQQRKNGGDVNVYATTRQ